MVYYMEMASVCDLDAALGESRHAVLTKNLGRTRQQGVAGGGYAAGGIMETIRRSPYYV